MANPISHTLSVLLLCAGPAFAQAPAKIDPSPVLPGQPITISGIKCDPKVAAVAVIGPSELPLTAGKEPNTFQGDTKALPPGTYRVTLRCGTANVAQAALVVLRTEPPPSPKVTCVQNLNPRDGWWDIKNPKSPTLQADLKIQPDPPCSSDARWIVRMESNLAFHVQGYLEWRDFADNARVPLHVFINGIEVANLTPRYQGRPNPETGPDVLWTPLKFESNTDAIDSRDVWAQVIRSARANPLLDISIGPAGGPYWPTTATVMVNSYPTGLFRFAISVLIALVAGLLLFGRFSLMLRDSSGAAKPPFSLAKHQMAVWFVVVVGVYLFVMMTTGAAAATSATALILIGISGATGLTAIAMDTSKREVAAEKRPPLLKEKATLETELQGALPKADADAKTARLADVNKELLAMAPASSKGWFKDLLSDENGISFHRLQISVWTIVLVGTFVVAVWRTFAMPDFDATTLGLMGISSGMYLGFKFPEKP